MPRNPDTPDLWLKRGSLGEPGKFTTGKPETIARGKNYRKYNFLCPKKTEIQAEDKEVRLNPEQAVLVCTCYDQGNSWSLGGYLVEADPCYGMMKHFRYSPIAQQYTSSS